MDLIFLAVFRSLFQYTVLIVFSGKRARDGEEAKKKRQEMDGRK